VSRYIDFLARKNAEYGSKFDASDLAPQFVHYYNTGERIEVTRTYSSGETFTRRGRVGITTGWRPAFLLVSRRGAFGSSDVLDTKDVVVKVVAK
jgi:hypothetical protein